MTGLPLDVWGMMMFSIFAFWGVATWALVRTLRQEEEKLRILQAEGDLESHSPEALRELRAWIEQNPDDPDVADARATYNQCVDTLQTTDQHVYDWSDTTINQLDRL